MSFDLEWLLSPMPVQSFLNEHYGRQTAFIECRDTNHFRHLFSARAAEIWMWQQEERLPSLVFPVKDGNHIKPPTCVPEVLVRKAFFRSWLLDNYRLGATLVCRGLHRSWYPVALLQRGMETPLQAEVQNVNAYLTPPGSQGLTAHFDTHDVFVAQIEGRKRWKIYHEEIQFPLESQKRPVDNATLGTPTHDFVMVAGDVLYIPRGTVHEAATQEEASIHLTVGLHPWLWIDLLEGALRAAAERDINLRRVVRSYDHSSREELAQAARALLRTAVDGLQDYVNDVADRRKARFLDELQLLPGTTLESGSTLKEPMLTDRIEKQPGVMMETVSVGEDQAGLQYAGTGTRDAIVGPSLIAPALAFIANAREPFTIAELPELSDASKLELTKRLLEEGIVRYPESEASASAHL